MNARTSSRVAEPAPPRYDAATPLRAQPSSIQSAVVAFAPDIARACARHAVRRLTLFGSFATGDARPGSDLDLCVDFESLDPAAHADAYFGLLADLQHIVDRPVDLVEREAVSNPFVRTSIEQTEVVLYASPRSGIV